LPPARIGETAVASDQGNTLGAEVALGLPPLESGDGGGWVDGSGRLVCLDGQRASSGVVNARWWTRGDRIGPVLDDETVLLVLWIRSVVGGEGAGFGEGYRVVVIISFGK
jgi:hypothetical protein